MRELTFDIEAGNKKAYLKIADSIRHSIRHGKIMPGELLPATRRIAELTGYHRHTIMNALSELVSEGWLIAIERKGYIVSKALPDNFFKSSVLKNTQNLSKNNFKWKVARDFSAFFTSKKNSCKYVFHPGMGDMRLFPKDELRMLYSESLREKNLDILNEGDSKGYLPLRNEVRKYLRRLRSVNDKEIVITNGFQEGIFLISQLLLKKGDVVLVPELSYPPAIHAFRLVEAKIITIPLDEQGLVMDKIDFLVKKHNVKMIYTTPHHQYPTTVTLPVDRRLRLYNIAKKYQIPILEDDYDHEFHYRSMPIAPMAAYDPSGLIIYISTFSKALYPSARLGFMAIPSALLNSVSALKKISSRHNELIGQSVIAKWMKSGGAERHLRKVRRHYKDRRDFMVNKLNQGIKGGLPFSFNQPDGGMAIWLDTSVDSSNLAKIALGKGVFFNHEVEFSLRKQKGTHIRLGFANLTIPEINSGLELLFDSI